MKKQILFTALVVAVGTMSFVQSENGKAGYTASPGEVSCNASGCHTGHALNSGTGSVVITAATMPNWEYNPGQVYPISVTVAQSGISLFGIGFEALKSNGANGGTLAITNSAQTKILNKTISGNVRSNVVHTLNGGASSASHTFTFNWTAPATGTGNVTFYVSGNAANGNGSESGDYIYTASQVVSQTTTALNDINAFAGSVNVFPNPVSEKINVHFALSEPGTVEMDLVGMDGKICDRISYGTLAPGEHEISRDLPQGLKKGNYLLTIHNNGNVTNKKIMVL